LFLVVASRVCEGVCVCVYMQDVRCTTPATATR